MKSAALLAGMLVVLWFSLAAFVSSASVGAAIRAEDNLHATWLGERTAQRILARGLAWIGQAAETGRDVAGHQPAAGDPLPARLTAAADSLLTTPYIRAIQALGRLAAYRAAALLEWFVLGLPLLTGAAIDGALIRMVRTRSFGHSSPVLFGLVICRRNRATGFSA